MKAYILGDLQLHNWSNYGTVNPSGVNERILDIINELKRIRKQAVQEHVKHVFILGDVFELRENIEVVVYVLLYKELKKWLRDGIQITIIMGNHDKVPVGDYTSLEMLKEIAVVIDKPQVLTIDKVKILAVPYMAESNDLARTVRKHGKDVQMILLHAAIKGSKMPSGKKFTEGITLADLPKKAYVFAGHDHIHKQLQKRVWIVGSLLHVNRGDAGIDKVYAVFNSQRKQQKVQFRKTEGPKFINVSFTNFIDVKKYGKKDLRGNFVHVDWYGSGDQKGKVENFIVKKYKARAVDVETIDKEFLQAAINADSFAPKRIKHLLTRSSLTLPMEDRSSFLELSQDILQEALRK